MWDEIIYPNPNFNSATVEVLEWISNFVTHFTEHAISYPFWNLSYTMLLKGAQLYPSVSIPLQICRPIAVYHSKRALLGLTSSIGHYKVKSF